MDTKHIRQLQLAKIECLNRTTHSLKYPPLVDSHYGTVKITVYFIFLLINHFLSTQKTYTHLIATPIQWLNRITNSYNTQLNRFALCHSKINNFLIVFFFVKISFCVLKSAFLYYYAIE